MQTSEELKSLVREKYSQLASAPRSTGCCGIPAASDTELFHFMADDYAQTAGYEQAADLGLGCGLPVQFAQIRPGDTVVDLGSGAGNDCFVARHETGETGRVIGLDFTPAMVAQARANAARLGYTNVEFVQGDIEQMPLPEDLADVVVSNCVLNLVPGKPSAFAELYRILKPGGHFSISDIVTTGELAPQVRQAAELYAGCVGGAVLEREYLGMLEAAGFTKIQVQKSRAIEVPEALLTSQLSAEDIAAFRASGAGIRSITVYGEKPL